MDTQKHLTEIAMDINGVLGDLSEIINDAIKEHLAKLGLPENEVEAIWRLADNSVMINLYIANGDPYVKNEDVGEIIAEVLASLKILNIENTSPEKTTS
jgi:phosphoglycolate phosphatase-like HAD superfamily hydrolase